jgi:hypothetical protein
VSQVADRLKTFLQNVMDLQRGGDIRGQTYALGQITLRSRVGCQRHEQTCQQSNGNSQGGDASDKA